MDITGRSYVLITSRSYRVYMPRKSSWSYNPTQSAQQFSNSVFSTSWSVQGLSKSLIMCNIRGNAIPLTNGNQTSLVSKLKGQHSESTLYLVIFIIIIVLVFLWHTGWLLIVRVIVSFTIIFISEQREKSILLKVRITSEPRNAKLVPNTACN